MTVQRSMLWIFNLQMIFIATVVCIRDLTVPYYHVHILVMNWLLKFCNFLMVWHTFSEAYFSDKGLKRAQGQLFNEQFNFSFMTLEDIVPCYFLSTQESLAVIIKFQCYRMEFFCQNKNLWKMPKYWLIWSKTAKLNTIVFVTEFQSVITASESWPLGTTC